jgi:hypothetical protein
VPTPAPAASTSSRSSARQLQKVWWLRALVVLQAPKETFRAMRDGSKRDAEAREEPVLAIIMLAGVAAVLSFSSTSREFLDNPDIDGALVPILTFLAGGIYGFAGYWIGGLALHAGVRGAKGEGTYRLARHVLAYSLVPLAASLLVVWPLRLVVFGSDNFRTGGADDGSTGWIFTGIQLAFVAWSLVVLVVGVREVYAWSTVRSLGALTLTGMALLALALVGVAAGGF